MNRLIQIIKKNLKLLIRSKSSALIIILGPLLVIFLVGIAFDNINKFNLNIGTYSDEYTDLTDSFTLKLQEKDFNVQKIDSQEECINLIKKGKLNTCIIFPAGLTIESDRVNEITFYVDNSKINLVWMVLETISTKLSERSSELSMDLTTDLVNKVQMTKEEMYKIKPSVTNLKTESQQSVEKIETISVKLIDFRNKTAELKNTLLGRVTGAEKVISEMSEKINDSNTSSQDKNVLNTKLNEIGTYLSSMKVRLGEQESATIDDWNQLITLLDEVDASLVTDVDSIKANILSFDSQITQIQESVDKVYNEMSNIQITDAATIVNPITTNIKPVATEKTNLNYLFPSLVILVIMFISILLSNTLVMMEKHSPAYFRNFITPTNDVIFILATYLTNVFLVLLQLVIILAISAYFFKAQILSAIPTTIITLLVSITFFTFIGMLVGYLFNSEETSTLAAISLGSIFLFLSNVILPLETMPIYVKNIAQYNPFVLGENLLRKSIIFQAKLPELQNELLILLGYSLVLFVIIWLSQKAVRKHLLSKILYKRHKSKEKKAAAKKK